MSISQHGTSRRNVLKGAAWVAPAVVVATAAPAMAASGPAALVVSSPGATYGFFNGTIRAAASIQNANTLTTTAYTVLVTVALDSNAGWGAGTVTGTAPGFANATASGTGATRTFLFVSTSQLVANAATSFQMTVNTTVAFAVYGGTVTIQGRPGGGGTNGSASASIDGAWARAAGRDVQQDDSKQDGGASMGQSAPTKHVAANDLR